MAFKLYPLLTLILGLGVAGLLTFLQLNSFWSGEILVPAVPDGSPAAPWPDPGTPPVNRVAVRPGHPGLKVSNRTTQPLRLVLMSRKGSTYQEPVHWDFATGEGEQEGLQLALPDGSFQLVSGDVLMAFALDGSRRYWGPYVVGSTPRPIKVNDQGEWQLTLQP
ncbi:MAG: hypothetical protein IGQ88_12375 [Gloeomargaritaceae cyanobacterium C42_A2020_066]|nr:hypothetical protein [Gloeomargaritaceae cyanobacterium C42_A2020_066]